MILKAAPIKIQAGYPGLVLGSGNKEEGSAKIENFGANPLDTSTCNSNVEVTWHQQRSWFFGSGKAVRELRVVDKDHQADLQVKIEQGPEQTQACILNGQGANEIRFPLGKTTISDGDIERLEALGGKSVHVRFNERREEIYLMAGNGDLPGQGFLIQQGQHLQDYYPRWVK